MKIGFITDIHELSGPLNKAISLAEKSGCDELACLGDIIGFDPLYHYGRSKINAGETVRMVQENFKWVVAGNHDNEYQEKTKLFTDYEQEFLSGLPDFIELEFGKTRIILSHYLFPDYTGSSMVFIRHQHQLDLMYDHFITENFQFAFCGHDHPTGVGFGYPKKSKWIHQFKKAIHYMPFNRYILDSQMTCCLLPPLATINAPPGLSIWDTNSKVLDVISLNHL